jgi:hypothetical protein
VFEKQGHPQAEIGEGKQDLLAISACKSWLVLKVAVK